MLEAFTSKSFDEEITGSCIGCNCGCKFIAYIKDDKIVDITGHPSDKIGMGSFCTKGIALTQELPFSELRLNTSNSVDIKEKCAVYVDKFVTDEEIQRVFSFTDRVYSHMLYVETPKTIDIEEIPNKRVILNISEPSYFDVMLSRWIIDAFQKGAKLFSAGFTFSNMLFKSPYKRLIRPQEFFNFLENIESAFEKGISQEPFIDKFVLFSSKLGNTLIIIQDFYIKIDRDFVLGFLERMKKNYNIDYIITGDITNWPVRYLEEIDQEEFIINAGDMFRYLSGDKIQKLSKSKVLSLSHMPNMSVNLSSYYIPRKFFIEMDFRKKTAFVDVKSYKIFENKNAYSLLDILPDLKKDIKYDIKSQKQELKNKVIMFGPTIVDDLGHWSKWLHEIEPTQHVYINPNLAQSISIEEGELLEIRTEHGKAVFKIKISANVEDDVFFVSNGFDEYQPFYEGVRPGVLVIDKIFADVIEFRKL